MTNTISDLVFASAENNLEDVKLLVKQGADIHAQDDGALRVACVTGNLDIVKYLVSQGANIHARDGSALRLASENDYLEIVSYLRGRMIREKLLQI